MAQGVRLRVPGRLWPLAGHSTDTARGTRSRRVFLPLLEKRPQATNVGVLLESSDELAAVFVQGWIRIQVEALDRAQADHAIDGF